jgi:hypothetical protein
MIEKDILRKGDFVKVLLTIPAINKSGYKTVEDFEAFGFFLTRGNHTFYYSFMVSSGLAVKYWPEAENDLDILAARTVLSFYGFKEIPIFKRYEGDKSFKEVPGGKRLLDYITLYFVKVDEMKKEAARLVKENEKNKKVESAEQPKPDLKVVDKEESKGI